MKTLSVTCGDSSPKGRAKGLLQIGAAKKKAGHFFTIHYYFLPILPRPYVTTKRVTAQK